MKENLKFATVIVALVGAGMFIACSGGSPTAPETDVAYQPTAAPTAAGGTSEAIQPQDGASEAGLLTGMTGEPAFAHMAAKGVGCSGKKVAICHLPSGNPANIQEICVSTNAAPAHEAHGDYAPLTFWPDADGDGFGDAEAVGETGCTVLAGYVENKDDCDDGDAGINPGAEEVCGDGVDNNCNGEVDDGAICSSYSCEFSLNQFVAEDSGLICNRRGVCSEVTFSWDCAYLDDPYQFETPDPPTQAMCSALWEEQGAAFLDPGREILCDELSRGLFDYAYDPSWEILSGSGTSEISCLDGSAQYSTVSCFDTP